MGSPNVGAITICLKDGRMDAYDGKHSMSELYDHRCILFVKLLRAYPELSWRARRHHDADNIQCQTGFFLAGIETPDGPVTYHLPDSMWSSLDGIDSTIDKAPRHDGHGSQDALRRLSEWKN